jgi:hypothetical protein
MLASEWASKAKSKRETYVLLSVDCQAYLPPYKSISMYFMRDIVMGVSKCRSLLIYPYIL